MDLDGLHQLVAPWKGGRAYVIEYGRPGAIPLGNNGDRLLNAVFEAILPDLGLTRVPRSSAADVLLVRPGGALLDRYQAPRMLAERLTEVPDLPLIIFPSSSWFETTDPSFMFGSRTAPTLWISREPLSHRHLVDQWGSSLQASNVTLRLDHDVVVSGHDYVMSALDIEPPQVVDTGGTLLVARLGAESGRMAGPMPQSSPARRVAAAALRRVPGWAQETVRRNTTRKRQRAANEQMLVRMSGEDVELNRPNGWSFDISDPTLAEYRQYAVAIATASAVVTNRLHVALPSALLGKPTWLIESGYHKLRGVYEHSAASLANLTFLPSQ